MFFPKRKIPEKCWHCWPWELHTAPVWMDRQLSRMVDTLLKRYTSLDVRDYASLLHLTGEYRLAELRIQKNDWIAGRKISESRLRAEGINLLGIKKPDGTYIGNPTPDTRLAYRDILILYGRIEAIEELDRREQGLKGDIEHHQAIVEQQRVLSKQENQQDKASRKSGQ
jgi:K+/H+ antiporter YhaU regulatory subunit KhtT